MRKIFVGALVLFSLGVAARTARAQASHDADEPRTYSGPPLSLAAALREAQDRNPELIALRRQFERTGFRSAEQRFLSPPMLEAQIWQWPINTLNPSRADMYMISVAQEFPGRGKRTLRGAVLQDDVALLQSRYEARQRQLRAAVQSVYVELATVRH